MSKGYTVIELMVVISIILILSTFSLFGISNYKRVSNEFKIASSESLVLSFINKGKLFCREKGKSGFIAFDIVNNNGRFYCDGKRVESLILDKGITLENINSKENKIKIDDKGITSDACTITLRDMEGKLHHITVAVGTAYAEIKE